jgi:hypothetical protein
MKAAAVAAVDGDNRLTASVGGKELPGGCAPPCTTSSGRSPGCVTTAPHIRPPPCPSVTSTAWPASSHAFCSSSSAAAAAACCKLEVLLMAAPRSLLRLRLRLRRCQEGGCKMSSPSSSVSLDLLLPRRFSCTCCPASSSEALPAAAPRPPACCAAAAVEPPWEPAPKYFAPWLPAAGASATEASILRGLLNWLLLPFRSCIRVAGWCCTFPCSRCCCCCCCCCCC